MINFHLDLRKQSSLYLLSSYTAITTEGSSVSAHPHSPCLGLFVGQLTFPHQE